MEYMIHGYQPEALFRYFEEISQIPRGSGNEDGICEYLEAFAAARSIPCCRDAFRNVFMKVPATPGYEDRPGILLQGHTDMVCEKEASSAHDFLKDPLALEVKNGWLSAKGTTLGGDDGFAVATMLAVLSDPDLPHPALECLFTAEEEVGMSGVNRFDYSGIEAEKLINLDSEEEGIATVSCAGGARTVVHLPYERLKFPVGGKLIRVSVGGLAGGHSGIEIGEQRTPANYALARILSAVYHDHPVNLVTIAGGSKDNAISRECEAVFFTVEPDRALSVIKETEKKIRRELMKPDKGFRIRITKPAKSDYAGMMSFADTSRILSAILLLPSGVITRCPSDQSLVETSSSLGIVADTGEEISLVSLARSSSESRMDDMIDRFERLARLSGGFLTVHNRYPGWEWNRNSALQGQFLSACKKVYGADFKPVIVAIHAGLECGQIVSSVSHPLDAISIGPRLVDIHTPGEKMELASCERVYRLVAELLKA